MSLITPGLQWTVLALADAARDAADAARDVNAEGPPLGADHDRYIAYCEGVEDTVRFLTGDTALGERLAPIYQRYRDSIAKENA